MGHTFFAINDQNWTNMSVVTAQTKHCHAEEVPTLYPVSASFQQSEGYSNVLAPIPPSLSFRTDFLGTLEPPLEKDEPQNSCSEYSFVDFSKSLTQILDRNCALYDNSGARSGEATEGQDSYICSSGDEISLPFLH